MKSFVVRLWLPSEDADVSAPETSDLHGVVESVSAREASPFRSGAELLALLRARLRGQAGEEER